MKHYLLFALGVVVLFLLWAFDSYLAAHREIQPLVYMSAAATFETVWFFFWLAPRLLAKARQP